MCEAVKYWALVSLAAPPALSPRPFYCSWEREATCTPTGVQPTGPSGWWGFVLRCRSDVWLSWQRKHMLLGWADGTSEQILTRGMLEKTLKSDMPRSQWLQTAEILILYHVAEGCIWSATAIGLLPRVRGGDGGATVQVETLEEGAQNDCSCNTRHNGVRDRQPQGWQRHKAEPALREGSRSSEPKGEKQRVTVGRRWKKSGSRSWVYITATMKQFLKHISENAGR